MRKAVFLDRDGVLIEETHLLTDAAHIRLFDYAPQAVQSLKRAGYYVMVVTNQTVIARGMATEEDVKQLHDAVQQILYAANGSQIDAFYVCPHHPNATLVCYRIDCACRKPKPGLLLQAARDHDIDLQASYMIGDRITDIIAGARAGCKTILVQTGAHLEKPIETTEPIDPHIRPDFVCRDLSRAVEVILEGA